jgi:hypothetical protein
VFTAQVDKSGDAADILPEWRAARSDHKVIADAIANCESFLEAIRKREPDRDVDTMPRYAFSALLLDLTPLGAHQFDKVGAGTPSDPNQPAAGSGAKAVRSSPPTSPDSSIRSSADAQGGLEAPKGQKAAPSTAPIKLTDYQQAVLHLSDAIARGRLAAAHAAADNETPMQALGWATVAVSALATLFITIKSSMPAPVKREDQKPETDQSGWIASLHKHGVLPSRQGFYRFVFYFVGLLGIVLSGLVTVATGLKQFYDPLAAYKESKVALIELQRLHREVALGFVINWNKTMCAGEPNDAAWKIRLVSQVRLLGAYEAASASASTTPLLQADFEWLNKKVKEWQQQDTPAENSADTTRKTGDAAIKGAAATATKEEAQSADAATGGAATTIKPQPADAGAGNPPAPRSAVAAHRSDRKG